MKIPSTPWRFRPLSAVNWTWRSLFVNKNAFGADERLRIQFSCAIIHYPKSYLLCWIKFWWNMPFYVWEIHRWRKRVAKRKNLVIQNRRLSFGNSPIAVTSDLIKTNLFSRHDPNVWREAKTESFRLNGILTDQADGSSTIFSTTAKLCLGDPWNADPVYDC